MNFLLKLRIAAIRETSSFNSRLRRFWPKLKSFPSRKKLAPPKDDREFQLRLLAALERTPKHWFLAVLNSAIFIWLLTALLISFGGAAYGTFQTCTRDALRIIDRRIKIGIEYSFRYHDMKEAITASNSMDEIKERFASLPQHQLELKGVRLFDMRREQHELNERIEYDDDYNRQRMSDIHFAEISDQQHERFIYVFSDGRIDDEFDDDDLAALKDYAIWTHYNAAERWGRAAYINLVPNCSPKNIYEIIIGETPKIVKQAVYKPTPAMLQEKPNVYDDNSIIDKE